MRALTVIDPGPLATIQDLGRFGYQRLGISQSGAMDSLAFKLANSLVGNPPGQAAIEFTLVGGTYEVCAAHCRVAVTEVDAPIAIDGQVACAYVAHTLSRGSRLTIGAASKGFRGYIAVAGGFAIAPVLGSCSTHVRSRLGGVDGGPLKAGMDLPLVFDTAPTGEPLALLFESRPTYDGPIRIVFGPQDEYFDAAAKDALLDGVYRLTSQCDRMAYKLEGPPIAHLADFNVVSDGIANGSIQIPGSRQPLILLADRQPTGGFPKIATVIQPDLRRLGQLRMGDAIRFEAVSPAEAEAIAINRAKQFQDLVGKLRPAAELGTLTSERLLGANLISGVVGPSH